MRLLTLFLLLSACDGPAQEAAPERAKPSLQRDSLVIAVASDPKDLLSLVSSSAADQAVLEATSPAPMDVDFDCKISYVPDLAKSWIFGPDGKSITLTLRDDLTWEDGTPITADDYAFTYALAADPTVHYPNAEALRRLDPAARPRVVDPHTVEFRFTEAYDHATMLSHLAIPLVPKHVLDSPTVDRANLRSHPLNGSAPMSGGPFRIGEWEKGSKLVLVPNPAFHGSRNETSKLEKVIFKVIPEYKDRIDALAKGEVDLVDAVQVADADAISAKHPDIAFHRRGWRSMDYVAWNSLDPADYKAHTTGDVRPDPDAVKPHALFGDKALRRALTEAIDIDGLIQKLLTSEASGDVYGRPAVSTITPALCSVHNDAIVRIVHDSGAAKAALGALGWTDTNNDGWLDRDGQPLRFTLLTNAENPRRGQAAELIAAELKGIGVDMQVEPLAQDALLARLRARDFDAALTGLSAGLWVDPAPVWARDAEFNFTSYRSPEAMALLAKGLAEPDPDLARPIWKQFQQVVYDDQPVTFLYWMDELVGLSTRFRSPVIDIVAPYRRLSEWSVPIDKVKYKVDAP